MEKEKLVTPSFCAILAANFLLYFGFWLLTPILPFYLSEVFHTSHTAIGVILSCYTISSLCIRPFSGYILDTFARKPLYLLAYFIFTLIFAGYMTATALTLFIIFRIVHGFSFGMVTVGGNTLVIDIMPSSRRGEGLGYYGLTNNIAMSIGPMFGLFLHSGGASYTTIFSYALGSCVIGFIAAWTVRTPYKDPVKRAPISLDRFILLKGLPAGFTLLLLSIPYGMTTNYVAMYAQEIGITAETGFFFTLMAVGMAVSRLFSGRLVDKGLVTKVIAAGLYLVSGCYFALTACGWLVKWNLEVTTGIFFLISLLLGTRIWYYVSSLQYPVCKLSPQQPAWHSHQHLPDFMGCRLGNRNAYRRIFGRNCYLQNSLLVRSLTDSSITTLFSPQSRPSL